jgi:hypothetical protein
MPIGATLALRMKARGLLRSLESASLRSSVPYGHFAPLPDTLVGSTGFYTGKNRGCPGLRGGKSLMCKTLWSKEFLKSKCRSPVRITSPTAVYLYFTVP